VIEHGDTVSIEPLPARRAMIELVRNSWLVRVLNAIDPGAHFHSCVGLLGRADVRLLMRPRALAGLDEAAEAVEADSTVEAGAR
jgi:hypothetical protein